jgi:transcriptional regulator with XRE-family HTH domain
VVRGRDDHGSTIESVSDYRFDGQELRRKRVEAGLRLADLATAVGRSVPALVHWQNGSTVPSLPVLLRLSDVLGCHPADLFTQEEQELVST